MENATTKSVGINNMPFYDDVVEKMGSQLTISTETPASDNVMSGTSGPSGAATATMTTAAMPMIQTGDIDINSMGDGGDRDPLIKSKPTTLLSSTPFNVTATPFVSNQMRNAAVSAAMATSTPYKEPPLQSYQHHAHNNPYVNNGCGIGHADQHLLPSSNGQHATNAAACPNNGSPHLQQQQQQRSGGVALPHIAPIPYAGPKGVDGRIWRSISARHLTPVYSYEDEVNRIHTSHSQYSIPFSTRRNPRDLMDSSRSCGPVALPNGTLQLRLRDGIRVDMTLDKAVRVSNYKSRIAIALSANAGSAALFHPNGKVYQYNTRVEIVAYDGMHTNSYIRYAKMWYKGVSFTSENCALIYLVDTAGTRTTTDSFTDMNKDYTLSVFFSDSRHGSIYAEEAMAAIQNANYWCNYDGTEVFDINGFRITQTADGLVKVTRSNNKCLIRTSPGNGSATLTTPFMHCTASLGQTSHLFVRRGERRMHFDGSSFVVRNAGHSAGFDDNNLLKVY